MSTRTWIGSGRKEWADYNSEDYPDMESLASAMKWQLPAKLQGNDPSKMLRFFEILSETQYMNPEDFWAIWLGDKEAVEHPSWKELREYLGFQEDGDITDATRGQEEI